MEKAVKEIPFIFKVKNVLQHKKLRGLRTPERIILLMLAFNCNEEGKTDIHLKEISDFSGITKNNINRYLKKLTLLKVLSIKHNFERGKKSMTKSTFLINIKALIDLSIDEFGDPVITKFEQTGIEVVSEKSQNQPKTYTQYEDTSSSNIKHISNEPILNMSTGYPHIEEVKHTSNIKTLKATSRAIDQIPNEPDQKVTTITVSNFDLFWAAYPRKQGKQKALLAWHKKGLEKDGARIVEDVILRSRREVQWKNKEYVPHASTYLNGELWNDEIIEDQVEVAKQTNQLNSNSKHLSATAAAVLKGRERYERLTRQGNGE